MNCKPDQRAVFTRTLGNSEYTAFLGMVFVVRKVVYQEPQYGPLWEVDPDNISPVDCSSIKKGQPIRWVADALLTPLPDDPGPDVEEDNEITNPASVEA